jgi:orotate phosphoribosyltransferase-like protein
MSYLPLDHTQRRQSIDRAVHFLLKSTLEFETIVCTGLSGLLVAPEVSERLGKNLAIIRKGESSRGSDVERTYGGPIGNYIILDDFVESGRTIARVIGDMNGDGVCVGSYFYGQTGSYFLEKFKPKFAELAGENAVIMANGEVVE